MILAIQNDRLIFFLNHENVDRRYDFKAGKIKKVQSCFFKKNNPKDEKEAATHAFLFRGNFIRKFMR